MARSADEAGGYEMMAKITFGGGVVGVKGGIDVIQNRTEMLDGWWFGPLHLYHTENGGTACGRKTESTGVWLECFVESLNNITCKSCKKTKFFKNMRNIHEYGVEVK